MGHLCLLLSSPEVSGYRGVDRRIRPDSTGVFNDDFLQFRGNTRSLIGLYRRAHACILAEGGGLKFSFGDENPEFILVVDSPSAHVQ